MEEHGHLLSMVNPDCTDDDAAKECAKRLADGHKVELWRLVAGVGPSGRTGSGYWIDRPPGVLLFKLYRADVAES